MLHLKKLITGLLCFATVQLANSAPTQAQLTVKPVQQAPAGLLYVSIPGVGVQEYNAATKQLVATVPLHNPTGVVFDSKGNFYIGDNDQRVVYRINSINYSTFASNPSGVLDLTLGLDGNLLVVGQSGSIQKFNATTGSLIGTFAMSILASPYCLKLGPNGYLYTCNRLKPSIVVFDANKGGGPIGSIGTGGAAPLDLTFGPDGNLYATVGSNVLKFSLAGAYLGVFARGFNSPFGLAFGPNGNLYVSDAGTNTIWELNGKTGATLSRFNVPGGPSFITFPPPVF